MLKLHIEVLQTLEDGEYFGEYFRIIAARSGCVDRASDGMAERHIHFQSDQLWASSSDCS